jgi:hypothetical protein
MYLAHLDIQYRDPLAPTNHLRINGGGGVKKKNRYVIMVCTAA